MKTKPFDATKYLTDEESIAEYLKKVMEIGDTAALLRALRDVAKARGMSSISEHTGLSRESLYRSLRPSSHPQFETIVKVLDSLGLRLSVRRSMKRKRVTAPPPMVLNPEAQAN